MNPSNNILLKEDLNYFTIINNENNYIYMNSSNKYISDLNFEIVDLFHSIAEFLQYTNHGTTFFLYSLSGRAFRKELKILLKNFYLKICTKFKIHV